jgi:hypothetical protein
VIDLFGLQAKSEKRKRDARAQQLGEEGGQQMGDSINRYMIARVKPSLEGALTHFRERVRSVVELPTLQAELADFLEWLEEAQEEITAESPASLFDARRMAAAVDLSQHYENVLRKRLSYEVGQIALAAFDYAGVLAEPLNREQTDTSATGRISEAMLRIGTEELRAEGAVELSREQP